MIRSLLLAAIPLLLAAETPGPLLSVPVLGYIFDAPANTIRQVTGVPGAAGLDQPVAAGVALEAAWVDSGARVAVAITKNAQTAVVNWRETPRVTVLETSLGGLTAVAFSASGDTAALTDGTSLEVWSGLTGTPSKTATHHPAGGVSALAVRADGAAAAASGANILLFTGTDAQVIAAGGNWSALTFAGDALLAADAGALVRIENGGRTVVANLTGTATAIAVSKDGTHAAVALTEDLLVADLAGSAVPVACGCAATHLEALEGNLVLHLAGAEGAPLVLDAGAAPPRVLTLAGNNPGGIAQ